MALPADHQIGAGSSWLASLTLNQRDALLLEGVLIGGYTLASNLSLHGPARRASIANPPHESATNPQYECAYVTIQPSSMWRILLTC